MLVGALRDLWILRGAVPRSVSHTLALLATLGAGSYAGLLFAALITRETFQFGPPSNIWENALVVTAILVAIAVGVHWTRVVQEIPLPTLEPIEEETG